MDIEASILGVWISKYPQVSEVYSVRHPTVQVVQFLGSRAPRTALDPAMLKAFVLLFVQLMLVTAIALFLSTSSSSILSATLTIALYVAGHFNADLRTIGDVIDAPAAATLAAGVSYVLPNMSAFDVSADVVHAQPVTAGYMMLTSGYALVYIICLLLGAMFVFSRRDFT